MRRRSTAICLALAALAPLAAPAAAPAKTRAKRPLITRVTPMRVRLGETLTIRGRNFSSRRSRNTLIFRAASGRSAFAKPRRASRRRLLVVVPPAVGRLLARASSGGVRPTRFKLRVVSNRRFSGWTRKRLSPVVLGAGGGGTAGTGGTAGSGGSSGGSGGTVCLSSYDDGDLLPGSLELQIGTDPCLRDTDGDGIDDGYEYKSAIDLNDDDYQNPQNSLPYPGARPYPNALDPSDAGKDFDGDSLTDAEEQALWRYTVAHGATPTLFPLTYSAGEKYSVNTRGGDGRRHPALAAAGYDKHVSFMTWATAHGYRNVVLATGPPWYPWHDTSHTASFGLLDFNRTGSEQAPSETLYYDRNHDGWLSDDERDEDADGLTNYTETHGPTMGPGWWTSCYQADAQEKPYPVAYPGTDVANADSDGDGVLDGADDQDHDDIPNVMETSRVGAFNKFGHSYPNDPLEGSGDDREQAADCKLAKATKDLISGQEPPIYWHQDAYGRVNPFNPCLPDPKSRTCPDYVTFGVPFAPFDDSPDWLALN